MNALYGSDGFAKALTDSLAIYIDFDRLGLESTPAAVSQAVQRLLGLHGPDETLRSESRFNEAARDYFEHFKKIDPSDRTVGIFLAYLSCFFHEARHSHDLMSTIVGQRILRQYFVHYKNVPKLQRKLKDWQSRNASQPIPLPLSRHAPSMNGIDQDVLEFVSKYTELDSLLDKAGVVGSGVYSWVGVKHLLEASAVLVQLEVVYDLFGGEAYEILWKLIHGGPNARTYTWLINGVAEDLLLTGKFAGRHGAGSVMNYLLWVALQGNARTVEGKEVEVSAGALYFALIEHVLRNGSGTIDVAEAHQHAASFLAEWGFHDLNSMLDGFHQRASQRLERSLTNITVATDHLFNVVETQLLDSFLPFCHSILADPEAYFSGRRYTTSLISGELPGIPIYFKANGEVFQSFTPGEKPISRESAENMIAFSSMIRLLVNGRRSAGLPFVEDTCFEALTADAGLVFSDRLFEGF
ncbi:hypothetical protein F3J20_26980 [Paraburkholderia sp. Cy-641]|uniref:hypothetical protein n=1 Tax=Paraburkholderia sp. Cy-641 TaxID=2608337 RepID=UPI00141DAA91|nr:hypothetical protein [Paraburkholderia sp. Cy-641]NIF80981.1 hypothetical protein [Paraburkholderia sp. Cy-641]